MIQARVGVRRDLRAMLGVLSRGRGDPAFRREGSLLWLTGVSPAGVITARLAPDEDGVLGTFWGPGADWAAEHLADWVGAGDDASGFLPQHPLVERQWRRYHATLRVPRMLLTWQIALAAVLEQRVTGVEARGAWRGLITEHGVPAPGPVPSGMLAPPTPDAVLAVPSWDWRRYGVDRQRLRTVRELARGAHVLREAEALAPADGREHLRRIPGIGPWTAAEISARALADTDSVSVGDYHLARNVTYALTGRTDGTDADMLELLAPYAGHRHRAVRLIELAGASPPRRGPRMRLPGPR